MVGFASLGVTFIPTVFSIFLPGSPFELVPGVTEVNHLSTELGFNLGLTKVDRGYLLYQSREKEQVKGQ